MKLIVFNVLVFLLLGFQFADAQNFADEDYYLIDSLDLSTLDQEQKQLLDTTIAFYHRAKDDTIRINAIFKILNQSEKHPVLSIKYCDFQINLILNALKKSSLSSSSTKKLKHNLGRSYNIKGARLTTIGEYASALHSLQKSLEIREKIEDKSGITNCLIDIGFVYKSQGNLIEGLDYYQRSLKISEEIGDKRMIANSLNNIGLVYKSQGNLVEALNHYHRSLKISENLDEKLGIAVNLHNIASIYTEQGDTVQGLNYHQRSLEITEEIGDKRGISYGLNKIGLIYKAKGNLPQALEYFQRSLKLKEEIGDKLGIVTSLKSIGSVYIAQGDTSTGLGYYQRSLKISEEIGDKLGIATNLYLLALIRKHQGLITGSKGALSLAEKALKISKETGYIKEVKNVSKLLASIYHEQGKGMEAFDMLQLYHEMRDSMNSEKNMKAIVQQQAKYEYEKKMIKKDLAFALQKEKADNARNMLYVALLIILFLCVLGYFLLKLNKKLNRQQIKLKEQQEDIRKINNDLSDKNKELAKKNETIRAQVSEMNSLIIKLEKSNEKLNQFASIAAHDLKAPLRTIFSFSKILYKKHYNAISEKDKELFDFIITDCNVLNSLIDDLLKYSKTDKEHVDLVPTDLKGVVDTVINILHTTIEETETQIDVSNDLPVVMGQKVLLEQLFMNLITNAIKFRKKNSLSHITITSEKFNDKYVKIGVSDKGIGISKEFLDKVFEIFIKLHSRKNYEGNGIGLATCKRNVESLGGEIWVESEVGVGTTIFFTLGSLETDKK